MTEVNNSIDFIPMLEKFNIKLKPKGYSMYPLFVPERDEAVIAKADVSKLKRGDVVLYRRIDSSNILVLHRICKIRKGLFYMVGDNQSAIEGPIFPEQIKGILIGVIRNNKEFSVKNPTYKILSGLWLILRPVRKPISVTAAFFKKSVLRGKIKN